MGVEVSFTVMEIYIENQTCTQHQENPTKMLKTIPGPLSI